MNMIEVKGLSKSFGDLLVFENLDVEVKKGEVLVIIGPSGSGKSTFLRCLNNLEVPTAGTVTIEGEVLDSRNKKHMRDMIEKMGMVFQNFNLFPHMTVLQNVMEAPMIVKKQNRVEVEEKAKSLLKRLD